jgi:hypothetical protein
VSADPDPSAPPVREQAGEGGRYIVNASAATGVQVGEGNTQINYYIGVTVTDGVAQPPLVGVSGVIKSPYRGLSAFGERDAPFFFGRETAAAQVLGRMSRQVNEAGLLVVSGVSGAGKSSLLRAGVLPQIQGFEYDWNGVIIGPDLVWRGNRWAATCGANKDPEFRSGTKVTDNEFERLVRNVCKVLLTRGMIGTVIYSPDAETNSMLRSLVRQDAQLPGAG